MSYLRKYNDVKTAKSQLKLISLFHGTGKLTKFLLKDLSNNMF